MEPDRQPTLEGELVTIRPLQPDDWEALFAVASDPLIWELHPARDRWQEPVFRKFFDHAIACGGGLAILDKATGTVIGSSRYDIHVPAEDEIEIGWTFIARAYWGGTYNREIKRLMLDHIHRFVGTVVFIVGQDNLRSRGAMEKIGGKLIEGRRHRGDGTVFADHVVYAIRRL
ncbi:GNAT family N-acetyltransferase [Sphingomonas sp. BT-65]|uniref:GNAT family N-acetyltransferase n=1 Tax=Sphingomonas sp. BT-65 TaxID=2989821 RepID=UPI0022355E9B|nr:GNAT family N-acetyltransferase [Sphingomonas sp. BT-65]MCW4462433.1 GNAT family N-acetyltransferase [Sphingomonas sp. BT-65]